MGITLLEKNNSAVFTPKQLRFALAYATRDLSTSEDVLREKIGVPKATLQRWKRNPKYLDLLAELSRQYMKASIPSIDLAMVSKATEDKDVNAAKLCYSRAGIDLLNGNTSTSTNTIINAKMDFNIDSQSGNAIINKINDLGSILLTSSQDNEEASTNTGHNNSTATTENGAVT